MRGRPAQEVLGLRFDRLSGAAHVALALALIALWLLGRRCGGFTHDASIYLLQGLRSLDPPAFAKTRAALPGALRGYKDINLQAMKLLSPGGMLLSASCSHHLSKAMFLEMLQDAATDSGRRLVLRHVTGQGLDHPEILNIPETGYLKGALLEAQD